jgi:hypothetical protein
MEHPLIGNLDDLTAEQLHEKITELTEKLNIAYRTGNGHLCNQIRMALESYNAKQRERQQKQWAEQSDNFKDKIKIS